MRGKKGTETALSYLASLFVDAQFSFATLLGYQKCLVLFLQIIKINQSSVALPRGGLVWTCPPQFSQSSIF